MLNTKKPIVEINLTPLVDVSLVLVVIFMATAPMFIQSGIIVTSGEKKVSTRKSTAKSDMKNIVIKLEVDGIYLNQKKVSLDQLKNLLKPMILASTNRRVIINPSREVKHGRVVEAMDIAKQAGGDKIVILGKSGKMNDE